MNISDLIYAVMDETTVDITKRVAGITLTKCQPDGRKQRGGVLSVSTTGDYEIALVYCAPEEILFEIVKNMKRGPFESDEMEIYLREYFNVLCGRIISQINRQAKVSARFGLPKYDTVEPHMVYDERNAVKACYNCDGGSGVVSMKGIIIKPISC